MKLLFNVLLLLCLIQLSVSHISLHTLDFLNVGKYLKIGRTLLVGDPRYTKAIQMPFDPYQSDRLKGYFQQKYGFRGERLVHALGAGYSLADLKRYGAV